MALWKQPVTPPIYMEIFENQTVLAPIKKIARPTVVAPVLEKAAPDEIATEKTIDVAEQTPTPAENSATASEIASAKDIYISKLTRTLNSRKQYPEISRKMRQQGRLKVRFVLERDGRILNAELVEQSSFTPLNEAAKNLLTEIKKFEPFPNEVADKQWAVTVPIEYVM